MGETISREEHTEFARRMEAENKRLEDENTRQNKRLDILEENVRQIGALTTSVEKLAVNMATMADEQKKFSDRLVILEGRDGEKWRKVVMCIVTGVVTAVLGFLFGHLSL